jgi:formylglycine-generating enzyme required for sulfatase activity
VERANTFLADHPKSEDQLRRIFTLKLATVREDGEPTRRRAGRSEFSDEEWRLVSELADHPNRLLVTATQDADATPLVPHPASRETYAEVAHEAIFGRWGKLRDWIAAEREFLAWRTGLEAARGMWQATAQTSKQDALLMGAALTQAQSWLAKRRDDLSAADRDFIDQSVERARKTQVRARLVQSLVYVLLVGIIVVLIGVIKQDYLRQQRDWYLYALPEKWRNFDPHALSAERERALAAGAEQAIRRGEPLTFRECAKNCPEMTVVPAGKFRMGSPPNEKDHYSDESPQHNVTITRPFAVSKFDVTFADWDACVAVGGCPQGGRANDAGWGRGTRPVIHVNWDDAQAYVVWLSRMTGAAYRLLTEAEWEYAARAGTSTAYYWGDEIGMGNANCKGCGSDWDARQTSPVGSFKPNAFGLYDMAGNVWQWVEDCYHDKYNEAPKDGTAWEASDCTRRVARSGSWMVDPENLRSADRNPSSPDSRDIDLGFRVGRTLSAGAGAITVAPGAH